MTETTPRGQHLRPRTSEHTLTHNSVSMGGGDGRNEEYGKSHLKEVPGSIENDARFTEVPANSGTHFHIVYRWSDLPSIGSGTSGRAVAPSPPAAATMGAGGGGSTITWGERANVTGRKERNEVLRVDHLDRSRTDNRRLMEESNGNMTDSSESYETFRMPEAVESGVGGTWDGGPYGLIGICPSSPKVFEVGIAMDAGFFKVGASPKKTNHKMGGKSCNDVVLGCACQDGGLVHQRFGLAFPPRFKRAYNQHFCMQALR